jgi:hypothetical protein
MTVMDVMHMEHTEAWKVEDDFYGASMFNSPLNEKNLR